MKADEIMQVLRLTAMGRAGHPMQEEFAQKLAALLATPEQRAEAEMAEAGISVEFQRDEIVATGPVVAEAKYIQETAPVVIEDQRQVKRGPGRPKKGQ